MCAHCIRTILPTFHTGSLAITRTRWLPSAHTATAHDTTSVASVESDTDACTVVETFVVRRLLPSVSVDQYQF